MAAEAPEESAVGLVAAVEDVFRADEAGFEGEDAPADGAEVGEAAFDDGLLGESELGVEVFGRDFAEVLLDGGEDGRAEAVEFGGDLAEDLFGAEVGVEGGGGGGVGSRASRGLAGFGAWKAPLLEVALK
jgi:hypothetical protein